MRLFGIYRLAGRVLELRKLGYDIRTTMEGEGRVRYAVYRLASGGQ
jgi:hypothetical protein